MLRILRALIASVAALLLMGADGGLAPDAAAPAPEGDAGSSPELAADSQLPPRPARTRTTTVNACRRDSDCVVMPPSPCDCPPCGKHWAFAANRSHYEHWLRLWSVKQCRRPRCPPCEEKSERLGTRAVCVRRQCEVR